MAVAGNPNSGKSTLINAIAGTRLQVGNWAGVTVEKKEALIEYQGRKIRLVDLPGTYSLSPYTQEEIIARDYLVHARPDVIVDVVDATNLERNLYLTMQLLELGIPVIAALNIYDEAEQKGYRINTKDIEKALGIRAIPTVATKKKGLDDLLAAVLEAGDDPGANLPRSLNYGEDIEAAAGRVEQQVKERYPFLSEKYPSKWLAFKLMEGDRYVLQEINFLQNNAAFIEEAVRHLRQAHGEDIEAIMADARYAQAAGLTREVLEKTRSQPGGAHRKDRPHRPEPLSGHSHLPGGHVAGLQAHLRRLFTLFRLVGQNDQRPGQAPGSRPSWACSTPPTGWFPWPPTGSWAAPGLSWSSCPSSLP